MDKPDNNVSREQAVEDMEELRKHVEELEQLCCDLLFECYQDCTGCDHFHGWKNPKGSIPKCDMQFMERMCKLGVLETMER